MEQEDAQDAISIDSSERIWLPLGKMQEPQDERKEEQEHYGTTDETFFLTNCAEDEICILFRHLFEICLCPVEEAFAFQSARTNGNLGLNDIISGSSRVVFQAEQHADSRLLVGLHNLVQHEIG